MKNSSLVSAVMFVILFWSLAGSTTVEADPLDMSIPQWIIDNGWEDNELLQKGFLDVTLYDNWENNPVDSTGHVDSTVAIQKAINDAANHQLVTFFPNQPNGERGVYLISDILDCRMRSWTVLWDYGTKANVIVGSREGGVRPLIKLQPGASGFQDENDPMPMFWFWSRCGSWEVEDNPGCDTSNDPWDNDVDISFDQILKEIDLDLGENPGAIGVKNPGAQGSHVMDMKINATGAFAGIANNGVDGSSFYNIEITGGKYGAYIDTTKRTLSIWNGGAHYVGMEFIEQEDAVLRIIDRQPSPVAFTGFYVNNTESIPLVIGQVYSGAGGISFVDGVIDVNGGTLIDSFNQGVFFRDVYVRGADYLVNGVEIHDTDNWAWVSEYSSVPGTFFANLVEGDRGLEEYISITEDVAGVTRDDLINSLVKKHQWDSTELPSFEDSDVINVKDAGAVGNGVTDDTVAIENAITQAENENKKLFFPKGHYIISNTIVMRKDTKLFGASKHNTVITPDYSWKPAGEAIMLTTEDSAEGTAVLANILIGHHCVDEFANGVLDNEDQFRFTPIEWRVGRNSMLFDVVAGSTGDWRLPAEQRSDYHRFRVNGHGGGRWFAPLGRRTLMIGGNNQALLIENTDEPMQIYSLSNARPANDFHYEIRNSPNKTFYYPRDEVSRTLFRITDSTNIGIFTVKQRTDHTVPGNVVRIIDSDDILIAMHWTTYQHHVDENHIMEDYQGGTYTLSGENVHLFKRGEPDYTPIEAGTPGCGDGTCDTGECDSCPQDCTLSHCCGIEGCNPPVGETCSTCSQDCGACPETGTYSFRTQSAVSIDGNPSEWENILGYHVPYTSWVSVSIEPPGNSQDCSAVFKSMWDDGNLYVLVNVTDDSIYHDSDRLHNDDSTELYLDGGNEKAGSFDSNDFQLTVDTNNDFAGIRSDQLTFQHAAVAAAGSYVIEYAVPFSALQATPANGTVIGFDVAVNDDDDGGDTRESMIVWHGDGTGWQDPGQFGEIMLKVAHRADDNPRDGCVEEHELIPFIDLWRYDSTTNPMGEVMEAVTLWSRGTGCVS